MAKIEIDETETEIQVEVDETEAKIIEMQTSWGYHIRNKSGNNFLLTMPSFQGNNLVWVPEKKKPDKVVIPCTMSKNKIYKFYLEVFGLPVPARPTRPPQELMYLDNNSKGHRVMLYRDSDTKNGIYFLRPHFTVCAC